MEPEGSLPLSQQPAIGPHPETDASRWRGRRWWPPDRKGSFEYIKKLSRTTDEGWPWSWVLGRGLKLATKSYLVAKFYTKLHMQSCEFVQYHHWQLGAITFVWHHTLDFHILVRLRCMLCLFQKYRPPVCPSQMSRYYALQTSVQFSMWLWLADIFLCVSSDQTINYDFVF